MNNFEKESETKILALSFKFLWIKIKKTVSIFFYDSMLPPKTFAANSLKLRTQDNYWQWIMMMLVELLPLPSGPPW